MDLSQACSYMADIYEPLQFDSDPSKTLNLVVNVLSDIGLGLIELKAAVGLQWGYTLN